MARCILKDFNALRGGKEPSDAKQSTFKSFDAHSHGLSRLYHGH